MFATTYPVDASPWAYGVRAVLSPAANAPPWIKITIGALPDPDVGMYTSSVSFPSPGACP